MSQLADGNKSKDIGYYIKSFIGIAIMIFFQFIPAPAPITQAGMAVLGYFVGLIVLWTLVDLTWPTFLAIVLFAFQAKEIYPASTQMHGIYEAGVQSFGNWITIFVIGCLVLTVALEEAGVIRRLCYWFLTRKFAKKSPWTFTFMLLLSALVVGMFLDVTPAQFFILAIAHELFTALGFKKGDSWPRMIVTAITFTVIIAFTMTPICHTLPILFMGISASITGAPVNMLQYMLVGIPIGFIVWLFMFLWFRYFSKTDISQFANIDLDVVAKNRPGKMEKKEKFVLIVFIIVLIGWLFPGFLSFLAPTSALNAFMEEWTGTAPLFIGIVLLCLVRIDGKPVLSLPEAFSKISWIPILLLAGIMMVAGAMGESTTGIPDWLAINIVPLTEGLSPFALVALISVLCCILTNVANNVPTGILFVSVASPIAMQMGINPTIVAVAVCIGANLAYTIPPAYVPIGVAYSDPYCNGGYVLRNGIVMTVLSCIILAITVFPIGSLVY